MAFNRDITNLDISTHGVVACPDRMTGSAQQNKQRFDELVREVVKEKFNGLLDDLEASTAAGNIGFTSEDLEATNIKEAIEEVNDNAQSTVAKEWAEKSEEDALISEGWAVGKQNGEPVSQDSEYYHNNADYYANVAKNSTGVFKIRKESTTLDDILNAINDGKELILVEYISGGGLAHDEIHYKLVKESWGMSFPNLYFLKESGGGYYIAGEDIIYSSGVPTYHAIHSGITAEDLSDDVQESLGKADTALQPGDFTRVASTMAAASWSGSTYSFEGTYPAASYDITVEPASTATSEQYKAFAKAMLAGNALTNVLTAIGTVPTVDIPVIITAMAK